jgi:hypothetical protein
MPGTRALNLDNFPKAVVHPGLPSATVPFEVFNNVCVQSYVDVLLSRCLLFSPGPLCRSKTVKPHIGDWLRFGEPPLIQLESVWAIGHSCGNLWSFYWQ